MTAPLEALDRLTREDVPRFGSKAAHLGELLRAGFPVPDGVALTVDAFAPDGSLTVEAERSLRQALDTFGEAPLAVRSSAVAEDLPEASFAGQYETALGVTGPDAIIAAVRRCRDASSAARLAAYRATRAPGAPAGVAILVQRLIPADAAGVAFTANPLSGARDETVVTAVRGLGERLVSGRATPDECTVRGETVSCRVVEGILSEERARAVATLARRVEQYFGTPQDIEWAITDERLHLLQARPMTALPASVEWTAPLPGTWLRHFRLGEWIGDPITPLFESWLLTRLEDRLHENYHRWTGLPFPRPYHVVVNGWYYYGFNLPATPGAWLAALVRLLPRLLTRPRRVAMILPPTARFGIELFVGEWRERILPAYKALADRARLQAETLAVEALPALLDEIADAAGEYFTSVTCVAGFAAKAELPLALFYRAHLSAIGGSHMALLGGLATTPSTYGHAVQGLDWVHPTLGEISPDHADVVAGRRAGVSAERAAAVERCRAALARDPELQRRFDAILSTAQRFAALREEQIFSFTLTWPIMRRALLRIGETLGRRGLIATRDDVFFLTREELVGAIERGQPLPDHARISERRATWTRQRRLTPPLLLGELSPLLKRTFSTFENALRAPSADATRGLRGIPASPGRVTAAARVIRSSDEFERLRAGEVLVAPVTTPAWTVLFGRAAAVVTDTGGVGSHSSIVAREYGIPAVVGTGDATARVRDGDIVTVDGAAGVVLISRANAAPAG